MGPRRKSFDVDEYLKGPASAAIYERQVQSQDIIDINKRRTESIEIQAEEIVSKLQHKITSTAERILREGYI